MMIIYSLILAYMGPVNFIQVFVVAYHVLVTYKIKEIYKMNAGLYICTKI